jgi:hypothetical protein
MRDAEFEQHVGAENICPSVTEALQQARKLWSLRNEQGSPAPKPLVEALPARTR